MKKAPLLLACLVAMIPTACVRVDGGHLRISLRSHDKSTPYQRAMEKGHEMFALGNYALAIESFRKAARYGPASPDAYNGMAASYAMLGRYDLSRPFFELALSHDPANAKVRRNYARSLVAEGRFEEARAAFAQIDADAATGTGTAAPGKGVTLAQIARGNGDDTAPQDAPADGAKERKPVPLLVATRPDRVRMRKSVAIVTVATSKDEGAPDGQEGAVPAIDRAAAAARQAI